MSSALLFMLWLVFFFCHPLYVFLSSDAEKYNPVFMFMKLLLMLS